MKKVYTLPLLSIPFVLTFGFLATQQNEESGEQEEQVQRPSYHLESDFISMADVGQLLERLGREVQQNGSVTAGGNTYPVNGYGGIEWGINQRERGTGVQIEFRSSGQTTPPTEWLNYTAYQRNGRGWAPVDLADLIAEFAETLASTGAFIMEDHSVAFEGTALVEQRLAERSRQAGRLQYVLETHVTFGEGDVVRHSDDEDYEEELELGVIRELGTSELEGVDKEAVAETFASLSEDLRAGRVRVGDAQVGLEEVVGFNLTHVATTDGRNEKIEFGLRFGPQPEPGPREPRFHEEPYDQPMMEVAALLQRIATEILEDGTFELGGEEFTVGETANYEIFASPRGFAIELSYNRPAQQ